MIKRVVCDATQWNDAMQGHFQRHILQSSAWAAFKNRIGWQAHFLLWYDETECLIGGANLLEKTSRVPVLPVSVKIMYCPRGPVIDWQATQTIQAVLSDLVAYARGQQAVYIKIDPEVFLSIENEERFAHHESGQFVSALMKKNGWQVAKEQIQFKNTFWLSLQADEETLLANMKQKTRYNIRLAVKKGIKTRIATELDFHLLYRMYAETAQRDGFIIRSEAYYTDLWQLLYKKKMAYGLIAEYEGEPLAGLVLFIYDQCAWYFYGMSTEKNRNFMPTYLLQWEAIRLAKQLGCTLYDLWGAPDELDESDSMYGVFRFKQGLGASLVSSIGAWDYVFKPFWYILISTILPWVLSLMRYLRRAGINKELAKE
jgi:peptidoglycan pentaglycine glycine transferase (the first glycine)